MNELTSLLDVAAAVADRAPVDWQALEARFQHPAQRALLDRLKLLDRIVRACADIVQPGETAASAGAPSDQKSTRQRGARLRSSDRIGQGTFGNVYRAHDRRLDRIVALKLLKPGREAAEPVESEVIREGQLLAKVRHPNIVTVYGAERIDGRVGVWMEFVDGRTLEEELRASGPLSAAATGDVGIALCGALASVHGAGVLHRDLKTQNVLRARDGRLLLADFGAGRAHTNGSAENERVELAGTPLDLAPELLSGAPASVASDLYSLGVLLYHLATGSFPVRARQLRELRDAHAQSERMGLRACRPGMPRALAAVIDRASHPDPARRFDSAEALGRALKQSRQAGRRVAAGVLVVVAGAAAGLLGLNTVRSMTPPPQIVGRSRRPRACERRHAHVRQG